MGRRLGASDRMPGPDEWIHMGMGMAPWPIMGNGGTAVGPAAAPAVADWTQWMRMGLALGGATDAKETTCCPDGFICQILSSDIASSNVDALGGKTFGMCMPRKA